MHVGDLLSCGLAIGNEPVDSIAAERLVERLRDSTCDVEEVSGRSAVYVGDVRCVRHRDEQGVPFGDGLNVHECDDFGILEDEACGQRPGDDPTKDTGAHWPTFTPNGLETVL